MDQNEAEPPFQACGHVNPFLVGQPACTRAAGHTGRHTNPASHPDGTPYSWTRGPEPTVAPSGTQPEGIPTPRRPGPARVRIERDPGSHATRVLIDGVDMSHHISEATWTVSAGKLPTATITFVDVDADLAAELYEAIHGMGISDMDLARLHDYAPALANLIEHARPVERREHVMPMGEPLHPYTPVAIDPAAITKLLPDEQQGA